MTANPLLRRLGFSDSDRVAIIHADDVGMCQASVEAFRQLDAVGVVTCGAVMVPCAWFPAAAAYARATPTTDLGVHLTLTSEWSEYRWGPVSTRDPRSGLMDAEGFFPHRSQEVQATGDPEAARIELEAQVERAKAFGIQISHVDTHMGSVVHPKFSRSYIELAVRNQVPGMLPRLNAEQLRQLGLEGEVADQTAAMLTGLEADGFPLLDLEIGLPLDKPENRLEQAKAVLAALPAGVTHFIIHPCLDTPELRAIAPDWRGRVADYQTFMREDLGKWLRDEGIQTIGYRAIRDVIRAGK